MHNLLYSLLILNEKISKGVTISHLILVTRNHVSISAGTPQVSWHLTRLQGSRFQEVLKKEFQVLVCSLEYVDIPSN